MDKMTIVYYTDTKKLCILKNGYIEMNTYKIDNQREMLNFIRYLDKLETIANKQAILEARISEAKI